MASMVAAKATTAWQRPGERQDLPMRGLPGRLRPRFSSVPLLECVCFQSEMLLECASQHTVAATSHRIPLFHVHFCCKPTHAHAQVHKHVHSKHKRACSAHLSNPPLLACSVFVQRAPNGPHLLHHLLHLPASAHEGAPQQAQRAASCVLIQLISSCNHRCKQTCADSTDPELPTQA